MLILAPITSSNLDFQGRLKSYILITWILNFILLKFQVSLLVKMAEWVNAVLVSSHNQVRITAKQQNNHHWEPEIWLKKKSTITKNIKSHIKTGGRGEDKNELIPYLHVMVKNWDKYFHWGGHHQGTSGPSPTLGSPTPVFWYQEEKSQ